MRAKDAGTGVGTCRIALARRAGLCMAFAACVGLLSGCYSEGGSGMSNDQHAYVSTTWQPKTVTLKDTRTGQSFWSVDVPVGRKLVVTFRENASHNNAKASEETPDMMLWDLMDPDEDFGPLQNQIPVPPAPARRLEMTLRASPELPESMGGGTPKTTKAGAEGMKK